MIEHVPHDFPGSQWLTAPTMNFFFSGLRGGVSSLGGSLESPTHGVQNVGSWLGRTFHAFLMFPFVNYYGAFTHSVVMNLFFFASLTDPTEVVSCL